MLFRETAKQAKRAAISQNFSLVLHPFGEKFRDTFREKVKNWKFRETIKTIKGIVQRDLTGVENRLNNLQC